MPLYMGLLATLTLPHNQTTISRGLLDTNRVPMGQTSMVPSTQGRVAGKTNQNEKRFPKTKTKTKTNLAEIS
jgi:hypothetical protein